MASFHVTTTPARLKWPVLAFPHGLLPPGLEPGIFRSVGGRVGQLRQGSYSVCTRRDSNPRPLVDKTTTLPTEAYGCG